jgi:hypothetical protein
MGAEHGAARRTIRGTPGGALDRQRLAQVQQGQRPDRQPPGRPQRPKRARPIAAAGDGQDATAGED